MPVNRSSSNNGNSPPNFGAPPISTKPADKETSRRAICEDAYEHLFSLEKSPYNNDFFRENFFKDPSNLPYAMQFRNSPHNIFTNANIVFIDICQNIQGFRSLLAKILIKKPKEFSDMNPILEGRLRIDPRNMKGAMEQQKSAIDNSILDLDSFATKCNGINGAEFAKLRDKLKEKSEELGDLIGQLDQRLNQDTGNKKSTVQKSSVRSRVISGRQKVSQPQMPNLRDWLVQKYNRLNEAASKLPLSRPFWEWGTPEKTGYEPKPKQIMPGIPTQSYTNKYGAPVLPNGRMVPQSMPVRLPI